MYPLIFLWILWCALHSLLISRLVTAYLKALLGRYSGLYRILYASFSILSLLPVLVYQHSLPASVIFSWTGAWKLLQGGLIFYAMTLFYLGFRVYEMSYFLGLAQWRESRNNVPANPIPFRTAGVLNYLRHPWYSGALAILWAVPTITEVSLVSNLILSSYLIIGTLLEEKRLKAEIGAPYRSYCKKVPMLVPWKLFNF